MKRQYILLRVNEHGVVLELTYPEEINKKINGQVVQHFFIYS